MTTILVIEDEIAICKNIAEILELEEFETLSAYDGDTGIELARTHLPDLVLCDIMMPGRDGYEVLMTLRDDPATAMIPFVFLTARADRPSFRQGMELGADDYLTKPFEASELVAAITARLDKQRAMTQRYNQALEDLRGNIFNMLPHELRTPLVSILGYAELLMWDTDLLSPQRVSEMAERILTSGKRLHRTIENFLIYAQIEIARGDPDRQAALRTQRVSHPNELTVDVAQAKARQTNRQADLQLTVADAWPVQIALESLQKILEELLDNAFKFSDPGTPVEVTAQIVDHAYQWVIRNQGRGMTAAEIAQIGAGIQFERRLFEQQGMGLGLVIAQQLAALYEATLDIESEPGVETTVTVTVSLS